MADGYYRHKYFKCGKPGHFAMEWPKSFKKRYDNVNLSNLSKPLMPKEEVSLVMTEISGCSIVEGIVGRMRCKDILLDTGAGHMVVKSNLVPNECYTRRSKEARDY